MSKPIRGQGGDHCFPISPKNTNLIDDVEKLLSDQFRKIPRVVADNKSKMYQPIRGQGGHLCFLIGMKNINLVKHVDYFASCQVLYNNVSG